jgi:dUTP pyrophosphatase
MSVRIIKFIPSATVPQRSNPTDAGADLFSVEECYIPPMERRTVSTGIGLEIPEGYYGRVAPRSGLASKHGIDVLAGVVDSGYRGEIKVVLFNSDKQKMFIVRPGDRIAQIIIEDHFNFEMQLSDELSETTRGEGGFGSTGT